MKIAPEIEFHERIQEEKRQKERLSYNIGSSRKNNRKTTKGRKTQYIHGLDDSIFPPKFFTKTIKHP